MKHFYFLLISLFIVGCSTDMNVSEQETERFFSQENAPDVLSDEETTLREKRAQLMIELWFNQTEYNKQLEENNQEAYHFERFFKVIQYLKYGILSYMTINAGLIFTAQILEEAKLSFQILHLELG